MGGSFDFECMRFCMRIFFLGSFGPAIHIIIMIQCIPMLLMLHCSGVWLFRSVDVIVEETHIVNCKCLTFYTHIFMYT